MAEINRDQSGCDYCFGQLRFISPRAAFNAPRRWNHELEGESALTLIPTRRTCLSILFAVGVLVSSEPAEAAHKIYLSDGFSSILIEDQDFAPLPPNTGADIYPQDGMVAWSGTLGTWTVNVTTGLSKPLVGPAQLTLSSVNVSGGAGTMTIMHTDTAFTYLGGLSTTTSIGGTTQGSVEYKAFFDASNVEFGQGTMVASFGMADYQRAGTGFSGLQSSLASVNQPYSLTQVVTIRHTGYAVSSFGANVAAVAVPEPASMAVGGLAVGFLAFAGFFFRKQS
jgi:hypothetical protein